jgi:hypothetical protein
MKHLHGWIATLVLALSLPAMSQNANIGAATSSAARSDATAYAALPQKTARAAADYGKLPLRFEANEGQTDARARFLARGPGYTLFLTPSEAVLALAKSDTRANSPHGGRKATAATAEPTTARAVLRLEMAGANPRPAIVQEDELPGKSNYFIGNDPVKWRTNVPAYGRVRYRDIYPDVDLIYYGNQSRLEHDFVVAPGGNPGAIAFGLKGASKLHVDADGDLVMRVRGGELRLLKPEVYQLADGARREVAGRYVLRAGNKVGFEVAEYDRRRSLVIDPVLTYSTYLGAGADRGVGIAVDQDGSAYVAGITQSADFPTKNAFQSTLKSSQDDFVSKLSADGSTLVYSTYLGGGNAAAGANGLQWPSGIAVDLDGNAYIFGQSQCLDFPTTEGAFQSELMSLQNTTLTKLSVDGSTLVYSTYLGGNGTDQAGGIAVDGNGEAYVTGATVSTNFPTTKGSFQTSVPGHQVAFVTKFAADGSTLVYSTFLGGSGGDGGKSIVVDSNGNAYAFGSTKSIDFPTKNAFQNQLPGTGNLFLTKFTADGSALVYSTYLGGSSYDLPSGLAVDLDGYAYVTGYANSKDFPTANAFQNQKRSATDYNAFVTKLATDGSALVYSTYLGGTGGDRGIGIAVNPVGGDAYVVGWTYSTDFPLKDPFQSTAAGAFVAKFAGDGALVFSTYFGGSNDTANAVTVDASDNAYVTGATTSADFAVTEGAYQTELQGAEDAYVTKFTGTEVPAATVVTANVNPETAGATVTFTAAVTSASGMGVPTGTVTFYDGTAQLGQAPLSDGQARYATSALSVGSHTIGADYSGDEIFSASSGTMTENITAAASVGVTVGTTPEGLSFSVDGTQYTTTQTLTWNAGDSHTIATNSPQTSSGTQNNFVSWSDGGAMSHSVTASASTTGYTATFSTAFQLTTGISPAGSGTVTPASGNYYNSGTAVSLLATPSSGYTFSNWTGSVANLNNAATTVTMTAPQEVTADFAAVTTPGAALSPTSLSFTSSAGATSASQTATLSNNGTATLAIASVSLTGADAADFTLQNTCGETLASGSNCAISVAFTPSATGSFSATLDIADNAAGSPQTVSLTGTGTAPPSFTVSSSTGPQSVEPGGSASYAITVMPQNGAFSSPVTLSASGLPPGATATFSQNPVTPGESPANSQLTVQMSSTSAALRNRAWELTMALPAMLGVLLLPVRRRRWILLGILWLGSLGSLAVLGGCRGGFGMTGPAPTYTITVSATSGSDVQTTTVQLTVQ